VIVTGIRIDTLYNNDFRDGIIQIQDKSIDMILSDLPYGVTARNKWDEVIPFNEMWKEINRVIKDNGAIVLFGQGMFTANLMKSNPKMWRYNLIWEKTQPTGFLNAKRMPMRSHEDICVFYKKQPTYNPQMSSGHERKISTAEHKRNSKATTDYGSHGLSTYDSTERYPRSVWKYAKDTQKEAIHPTQKPIALCEELIKTYTNEGDCVLDITAGSGTTGIAALNTGRHFIMFEKDEDIYKKALKRLKGFQEGLNG
jgi:site-specific DNA-methyltransferase (adenine-specific)